MAKQSVIGDREILEVALVGLEAQRNRMADAIRDIRSQLGIRGSASLATSSDGTQPAPTKRRMSAAGRRRIAMGQKKRWAAAKAQMAVAETPLKPKRKFSAAARKAMSEATKRRWAAFRKVQQAAA